MPGHCVWVRRKEITTRPSSIIRLQHLASCRVSTPTQVLVSVLAKDSLQSPSNRSTLTEGAIRSQGSIRCRSLLRPPQPKSNILRPKLRLKVKVEVLSCVYTPAREADPVKEHQSCSRCKNFFDSPDIMGSTMLSCVRCISASSSNSYGLCRRNRGIGRF